MLALLGAMKREIASVRRRMIAEEVFGQPLCRVYKGNHGEREVLLVQTGVGKQRAERAAQFVLEHFPVAAIISFGFAGALTEELGVGHVVISSKLHCMNQQTPVGPDSASPCSSDPELVSVAARSLRNSKMHWTLASSVTVPKPVSEARARLALGKAVDAQSVDMESYWIAKAASARGIPFLCVRAISDAVEDRLLPFGRFVDPNGSLLMKRATLYFLTHPHQLSAAFHLRRKAQHAGTSLALFFECFFAQLGH